VDPPGPPARRRLARAPLRRDRGAGAPGHGIRALNVSNGVANTPTEGYHETITAAYVTLIGEFLAAADPALTLERKVEQMLAGPIAERTVLLRFWSQERLMSPAARAAWVAPDRAPLGLASP
jgi:hypothetical protein